MFMNKIVGRIDLDWPFLFRKATCDVRKLGFFLKIKIKKVGEGSIYSKIWA